MLERVNEGLLVTVNNLKALEAVSEWIYCKLKATYLIQIEVFPNLIIYHICISLDKRYDEDIKKDLSKFLELKRVQFMEGSQ